MIALTFFFYFVLITGNYSSKIVLTWDWNGCYVYPGVYPINLLFAPVKKVSLLAKSEVDWNNASDSNLPDVPHYARRMNQSSWKAQWKINLDIDQDITYAIGFKQQNGIFALLDHKKEVQKVHVQKDTNLKIVIVPSECDSSGMHSFTVQVLPLLEPSKINK